MFKQFSVIAFTLFVPGIMPSPLTYPNPAQVAPGWTPPFIAPEERTQEFWINSGQKILNENLLKQVNTNVAKNLIIFVADGMSISTQTATRMYLGGEEKVLSFEKFPYVGLAKTYCVNYQVPDSACTATAFLSGIKTNFGVLSMSAEVSAANLTDVNIPENHVDSILYFAQSANKSTGIVTTSRITHATVAAGYAKSASRDWENDLDVPDGFQDIADQLIHGEIGKNFDCILGGGYNDFLPNNPNHPHGFVGHRTDNRDLMREWAFLHPRSFIAHDKASLNTFNVNSFDKLLGLFTESHMPFHLLNDKGPVPSLIDMSQKALEVMSRNPNGFVLLIVSGRIDHGHHENRAKLALAETAHLHEVVEYVRSKVNESETLIVVAADHSQSMTISGYPMRGTDILSFGDFSREDNMPYSTLSYANGPGYADHFNESGRVNPLDLNFTSPLFRQPATVDSHESTHSGDDVGVYAVGPYSHLFAGVHEQHYFAHAMMFASCLGPDKFLKAPGCSSATAVNALSVMALSVMAMIAFV